MEIIGMILGVFGMIMFPFVLFSSREKTFGREMGIIISSFSFLAGLILIALY